MNEPQKNQTLPCTPLYGDTRRGHNLPGINVEDDAHAVTEVMYHPVEGHSTVEIMPGKKSAFCHEKNKPVGFMLGVVFSEAKYETVSETKTTFLGSCRETVFKPFRANCSSPVWGTNQPNFEYFVDFNGTTEALEG